MSKDEFETLGRPLQQDRSTAARQQQALPQKQQRQRPADVPDVAIEPRGENFDTVPADPLNWWLPALLGGSVGVLAMLAIGTRAFSPEKQVAATGPNVPAPAAPATVSDDGLLLEQANLLAVNGDLAGAVEIAGSIPTGAETYTAAQQQITVWQGAIASARDAEFASAQAQAAQARQQQELAQAQAQAAEARRQQELAQEQARAAEVRRQQEVAQAQAQAAEARRQQELAGTQDQAAAARQQQEAAQARIQAAEAQAAEARRQQEVAQAQAAEARRQQEAAQAQAAEVRRQQEAARAQAVQARQQQEAAQAQAAEARRQQELARAQTRQQPLGNPASSPAQAQQSANPSPTADPFLSPNIASKLAPATPAAPAQVALAPSTPVAPGNSYGFRNVTVRASTVAIELRDNVDEDGDFVTLRVNGKEYATNTRIWNSGKTIFVPLQLGQNQVEIVGVKDGQGGITLEANVAGVGNVNNRPIPEGSTATFIIERAE